jgi:imidazolonepropionase-like amidohydrolase
MLGFDDMTGSISVGRKADLVSWSAADGFAKVSGVWVDGQNRFAADYTKGVLSLAGETEHAGLGHAH